MSDVEYSDVNDQVQDHIKGAEKKKMITDAQRSARVENLRKGRLTRMANLAKKKEGLALKKNTKSYKVKQYSSSESSESESGDEELVITKKHKKGKIPEAKPERVHKSGDNQTRQEIAELKELVLKLHKKNKRKRETQSTVINLPQTAPAPVVDDGYSQIYKSRILKL